MNQTVVICGILYRIARPEPWTVIFTEDQSIGGRPCRFMMHRGKFSIWAFQAVEGWGDTPAHHIVQAYEWCLARVGGDHQQEPFPDRPIVKHQLERDNIRGICYCTECGLDSSDQMTFRSCEPAPKTGGTYNCSVCEEPSGKTHISKKGYLGYMCVGCVCESLSRAGGETK